MRLKPFLLLLSLTLAQAAGAQKYCHVYDTDLYAFVRASPRSASPVVDTLFNLQVVRTGREENGWREIIGNGAVTGWAHSSRLHPMPQQTIRSLDAIFSRYRGILPFIAGTDLPHLLVYYHSFYGSPGAEADFGSSSRPESGAPIIISPDAAGIEVTDLRSGKPLCGWDEFLPVYHMQIFPGRLLLRDGCALYSFGQNARGGEYMSVVPDRAFRPGKEPDLSDPDAVGWGRVFLAWCEGKTDDEIINGSFEAGYNLGNEGVEEFMGRLAAAFFTGDPDAGIYPAVLEKIHADGGDFHSKIYFLMDLWIHDHTGIVPLDRLPGSLLWDY